MIATSPLVKAPRMNDPPIAIFSSKAASARPKKPSSASRPSIANIDAMQTKAPVTIRDTMARFCRDGGTAKR